MGVIYDFRDVKQILDNAPTMVKDEFVVAGQLAKEYAETHGSYQDVTGNLRHSTHFHATPQSLTLYNTAEYASEVEARGEDVLSSAFQEMLSLLSVR